MVYWSIGNASSSPAPRNIRWGFLALLLMFMAACSTSKELPSQDLAVLGDLTSETSAGLNIMREDSPGFDADQDVMRFDFCPRPASDTANLRNGAWLAYMASNQYSHLSSFAPNLLELGFGSDGDLFWPVCYRDLKQLRGLEAAQAIPRPIDANVVNGWGVCARDWYETRFLKPGNAPPPGIASAFEHYLVQETSPDSSLQFFTGGSFSANGKSFETGSTQMVWAQHASLPVVVVAFRGTEPSSLKDIAADAMIWKKPLSDHGWTDGWGSVHTGFMRAFLSVTEAVNPTTGRNTDAMVLEKLKEIEGGGDGECTDEHPCMWVTGHSLGAALATLFTSRVLSEMDNGKRWNLKGLYTFGSPRVGNRQFRERFDKAARENGVTVVRFRNEDDIVTRVPRFLYEHVDRLGLLPKRLGTVLFGVEIDEPLIGRAADHEMAKYYTKVKDALDNPENAQLNACLVGG